MKLTNENMRWFNNSWIKEHLVRLFHKVGNGAVGRGEVTIGESPLEAKLRKIPVFRFFYCQADWWLEKCERKKYIFSHIKTSAVRERVEINNDPIHFFIKFFGKKPTRVVSRLKLRSYALCPHPLVGLLSQTSSRIIAGKCIVSLLGS